MTFVICNDTAVDVATVENWKQAVEVADALTAMSGKKHTYMSGPAFRAMTGAEATAEPFAFAFQPEAPVEEEKPKKKRKRKARAKK